MQLVSHLSRSLKYNLQISVNGSYLARISKWNHKERGESTGAKSHSATASPRERAALQNNPHIPALPQPVADSAAPFFFLLLFDHYGTSTAATSRVWDTSSSACMHSPVTWHTTICFLSIILSTKICSILVQNYSFSAADSKINVQAGGSWTVISQVQYGRQNHLYCIILAASITLALSFCFKFVLVFI